MKALVGTFNKEKALVGAFSVIVQPVVEPMDRFTALFLVLGPDIAHHWGLVLASSPVTLPLLGTAAPVMLLQLAANVVLQYFCILSVFVLTTECTSLTASLVLTIRKFISVLFSIWYFQNPFTPLHWVGTGLVFGGIVLFSDIPGYLKKQRAGTLKKHL